MHRLIRGPSPRLTAGPGTGFGAILRSLQMKTRGQPGATPEFSGGTDGDAALIRS